MTINNLNLRVFYRQKGAISWALQVRTTSCERLRKHKRAPKKFRRLYLRDFIIMKPCTVGQWRSTRTGRW